MPNAVRFAVLVAVLCCIGCHKSEVELGGVEGKVTLDGQPLPDATVRFIPQGTGKGRAAFGKTDAEGHYKLLYSAGANGAVVGNVRVEITTADPDSPKSKEKVPARYNANSELVSEVKSGSNKNLDFDLTSK